MNGHAPTPNPYEPPPPEKFTGRQAFFSFKIRRRSLLWWLEAVAWMVAIAAMVVTLLMLTGAVLDAIVNQRQDLPFRFRVHRIARQLWDCPLPTIGLPAISLAYFLRRRRVRIR